MKQHDPWQERLSEYLDGYLESADRAALEAHLIECANCRDTLADIRELVALAGQLEDSAPARDLWPGIRDRIHLAGAEDPRTAPRHPRLPDLVRLQPARDAAPSIADHGIAVTADLPGQVPAWGRERRERRISFSIPQLAAACIALALLAGGTAWFLATGAGHPGLAGAPPVTATLSEPASTGAGRDPGAAVGSGTNAGTGIVHLASDLAGQQYDAAIADLERILAEGRGQLEPGTIAVLEENLAIIDRAIEEARNAIAEDPANIYLTNYLTDTMKRKLELLRYTNSLVRAQI